MGIIKTFHIESAGGWDYLKVCPTNNHLYVSHATQVNVLDKTSGDSVGFIPNTNGVHGIAFEPSGKSGYISNGKLNTVTVFDLKTNRETMQIQVGQNPDAIMYESFSKRIITCNGRSNNLSLIDPLSNKVSDSIDVGGKPEEATSDDAGRLYVNIEDKNELVVIDLNTKKVLNRWSLAPAEGPTGLAIDKASHRLFAGCEELMVVLDANNGKIINQVPIGGGCDGLVFDEATKTIYTSNGVGNISVIHEESANVYKVLETVETKRGARTIALDKSTHLLYLPTADFEAQDPNVKGRPKMKQGTFQILVVGKK
jgi:YVTN family beta-propeller protein